MEVLPVSLQGRESGGEEQTCSGPANQVGGSWVSGRLLKNKQAWNRLHREQGEIGGFPGAGPGCQDPEQERLLQPGTWPKGHSASEKSDHPLFC